MKYVCKAMIRDQDECYECGKPALHESTMCSQHIDWRVNSLARSLKEYEEQRDRLTQLLVDGQDEMKGLRKAIALRDSPNT